MSGVDHVKAIQDWLDNRMAEELTARPGKKLPELLTELYANEEFSGHVESMIVERMAAKSQPRSEAANELRADYFGRYRVASRAFSRGMDAHGGQLPYDLESRNPLMANEIDAGIYRCIADKLKDYIVVEAPPADEGEESP